MSMCFLIILVVRLQRSICNGKSYTTTRLHSYWLDADASGFLL